MPTEDLKTWTVPVCVIERWGFKVIVVIVSPPNLCPIVLPCLVLLCWCFSPILGWVRTLCPGYWFLMAVLAPTSIAVGRLALQSSHVLTLNGHQFVLWFGRLFLQLALWCIRPRSCVWQAERRSCVGHFQERLPVPYMRARHACPIFCLITKILLIICTFFLSVDYTQAFPLMWGYSMTNLG